MATTVDGWVEGVDGDFRLHNAVLEGKRDSYLPILSSGQYSNQDIGSYAQWNQSDTCAPIRRLGMDQDRQNRDYYARGDTKNLLSQGQIYMPSF